MTVEFHPRDYQVGADDPANPFGMPAATYDSLFVRYDDVAHALCCAEDAFAEMARRNFRRHLLRHQRKVSP